MFVFFFISTTFLIAFFVTNNENFLTNFKFINVTNTGLNYYIYYEKVPTSKNYEIIVYNNSNDIIYKKNTKNNSATITFEKLNYNEAYKIVVIAKDKEGNKKNLLEIIKIRNIN